MPRNAPQAVDYDNDEAPAKKKRVVPPRQMTAIVTVDDNGKVVLEAASYNPHILLEKFGELSRSGGNPQILKIERS